MVRRVPVERRANQLTCWLDACSNLTAQNSDRNLTIYWACFWSTSLAISAHSMRGVMRYVSRLGFSHSRWNCKDHLVFIFIPNDPYMSVQNCVICEGSCSVGRLGEGVQGLHAEQRGKPSGRGGGTI